ncbi:adenylate/guanylate cyclase domain-containing protein [Mycobacterium sp. pV006]|uniref:adenylate/guanylate cyclase domain-containing protein n=1 Tax=Mycobacterium sp. pV006 TaxID=3238983 RepID=UPI00351AD13D
MSATATSAHVPTGTVTLLLADIEGSTRLWDTQPDAIALALTDLDRVVAELVDRHHGLCPVQQGEGDSFVVAFTRVADAVACALDLQRINLWPIRLRIGIHSGDACLRDPDNYVGPLINRTARVRDLGHGGQTLLSSATALLVADALPPQSWLQDAGTYRLRGLARPEHVAQLCHPDLINEFPPLRAQPESRFHQRPAYRTEFIGRAEELDHLSRLLDHRRVITLCGPGGAGKTRLAVATADRVHSRFDDGARFLDLAPLTDPAQLPDAVALSQQLSDRRALLVVDNCEHLLDAAAHLIDAVLAACPNVTVLATSREPLAVAGEQIYRVPPLSPHDASALFAECAARANATFTAQDGAAVNEICRRLDGLPLAIEITAARTQTQSLADIRDSLHARLHLPNPGRRTVAPRHRTLRACMDWSYLLLDDTEKALLARLARLARHAEFDLGASATDDDVAALVDKSLVICEHRSGRPRYRLSETVRQYALESAGV